MQKKLLLLIPLFIGILAHGQSITLDPAQANENTIIKKDGIGLSHQSVDGAIKIGTKVADGDAMIQTHTNNDLSFGTFNSPPQMTLNKSGNLGIGTKTPEDRLDLRSNSGLRASIVTLSAEYAGLRFKNDLGHYFMGVNTYSNRFVVFDNNTLAERFTIDSQGFIGINKRFPTMKLHVNGDALLSENRDINEQVLIGSTYLNGQAKLHIANSYFPYALYIDGSASGSGKAMRVEGGMEVQGLSVFNGDMAISGNLYVEGNLSKSAGTFKIDHPVDPENKILYHSFVESPDMMNIYNGNIRTDDAGDATVLLPDYFKALNMDFRYQLTVIGEFSQAIVAEEITDNQFKIKTDKPNVKVSWLVTGVRNDAYARKFRTPIEVNKEPGQRGTYLNPEAFEIKIATK